jgi:hypothetical protein
MTPCFEGLHMYGTYSTMVSGAALLVLESLVFLRIPLLFVVSFWYGEAEEDITR